MRIIVQILGCLFFPALLYAQVPSSGASLSMSWEQNQEWLIALKERERPSQWKMVTDRYFQSKAVNADKALQLYTPLLIVNGLPVFITDSTSEELKRELSALLTEDKIADIKVVEKQPEGLYIEIPFAGIIIATVEDKKTARALKRIKMTQ